jgi:hypothetical protein
MSALSDKQRVDDVTKRLVEEIKELKAAITKAKSEDSYELKKLIAMHLNLAGATSQFKHDFHVDKQTSSQSAKSIKKFDEDAHKALKACPASILKQKEYSGIAKIVKTISASITALVNAAKKCVTSAFKAVGGLFKKKPTEGYKVLKGSQPPSPSISRNRGL